MSWPGICICARRAEQRACMLTACSIGHRASQVFGAGSSVRFGSARGDRPSVTCAGATDDGLQRKACLWRLCREGRCVIPLGMRDYMPSSSVMGQKPGHPISVIIGYPAAYTPRVHLSDPRVVFSINELDRNPASLRRTSRHRVRHRVQVLETRIHPAGPHSWFLDYPVQRCGTKSRPR